MTKRDGLHAALKATGKGMALVCYSMSRLARSTRDMLAIAEQLDAKHADLVSLTRSSATCEAIPTFVSLRGAAGFLSRSGAARMT